MSDSTKARAAKLFALAACAAGLLLTAAPASAVAPFSFDTAFGRLPKNVRPINYTVAITPDIAKKAFAGTESIVLEVRSATATIQFNTLNQTLQNVRFDGRPVLRTLTDNAKQLTTVTLAAPAKAGRHTLAFAYRGEIETSPVGLFVQPYVTPAGVHGTLLATQFESTDARRMFPCWDEPAFRATFDLTATVPAAFTSVSNMPIAKRVVNGALATTTFARTPPMPSYLVAYVAGDFTSLAATHDGTGFRVWTIKGQEAGGAAMLAMSQQILADYNAYFGYRFPLPVLNAIALPGGFQGGMENWGAIVYNDQTVLITPSSTLDDRQQVYSIVAHEMAHQWNGDLVTMGWWDDIWLNESFASWMAAKQTDLRNPTWLWWENQDSEKEKAMIADTATTSHPIAVHITDELQAETAFDSEITYAKGQAFLRMLEAYLGPDVFRAGIRRYIKARAFSNATAADLWLALSAASKRDVDKLASSWVTQPGFPLVSVRATCDTAGNRTIALAQRRFLLEGGDPNLYHWSIPLRVRSGLDGPLASVLVPPDGTSVRAGRCGEALTVNADALGYYRVAYDRATTAANLAAFPRLPDGDRIPLLDDQWALATAGQAPLASFLGAARSMNGDLDARAWTIITSALETIAYAERGTPGYNVYVTFASSILEPVEGRLGFDAKPGESPGLRALRRTVLADLGAWGDSDVISEAQRWFARFVQNRQAIKPDDQATVLGIVMLYADAATFDQMHAIVRSAKSETDQRRYYSALMGVRDDALAQRAIDIALSNEIPPQAAQIREQLLQNVVAQHPALAWSAFKANMHEILDPYGTYNQQYVLAHYVPALYWDAAPLDELESFAKANTPDDLHPDVDRAVERARALVKQKALLRTATDAYLAK
jgi:aminopeptidase N